MTEPKQTISAAAMSSGEQGMRSVSSSTKSASVGGSHVLASKAGASGRGGELDVIARFPDGSVKINNFTDLGAASPL